jgi:hypothetical protein
VKASHLKRWSLSSPCCPASNHFLVTPFIPSQSLYHCCAHFLVTPLVPSRSSLLHCGLVPLVRHCLSFQLICRCCVVDICSTILFQIYLSYTRSCVGPIHFFAESFSTESEGLQVYYSNLWVACQTRNPCPFICTYCNILSFNKDGMYYDVIQWCSLTPKSQSLIEAPTV